ncbi:MAG: hypothetical protein HRU12_19370 [Phaeodactylibacter sp.]|nr:hypothetical protein [Phaeodactylibacter sp.]
MKRILTENQVEFIKEAVFNGNPWDLYDSIAGAGLDTKEFREFASIKNVEEAVEKMTGFAISVLMEAKTEDGLCAL